MVAKTDPLGDEFVYSYDEENQLVKAVKNGTHVEDFIYDVNGMRVRKTAEDAVTDYFYDGVNLLYEVTGSIGKNHVWANGTLLCTVQDNNYTYYHTDHLGTSKLQTDGQGKVVSIDITKPYGPVAREGVMADTFADLSKIDPDRSRFQYDAATGTILPPARGRGLPKQITSNHEVTVEKTAYERVKNVRLIQTASDQANTELKIEFDFVGKARLTIKNKAGEVVFQDEYSGTELKSKRILVEVGFTLNQAYNVVLELAARNAETPSRSTIFSVSWGEAEAEYGFIRSLPVTFATEVYAVKLNLIGVGVTFYLNTGGKLWQRIEPGRETLLDQPGRTLTIRAYLIMEAGTNLQSYGLEINPYHDMSFTGKFLEPEIGLVYFGGRWYEPGVGRWITSDPMEDGVNWYGYCDGNPISNFDPDGMISWKNLLVLGKGIGAGFKMYAPKKALEIGIALLAGSAFVVGMNALMPILPAAIPIITAVMPYISAVMMVPFALDMAGDLQYLIKQFSPVFLSKNPPEAKVRAYGIRISKVAMNLIAMIATRVGMNAILKTGILQALGNRVGKAISARFNIPKLAQAPKLPELKAGRVAEGIDPKALRAGDRTHLDAERLSTQNRLIKSGVTRTIEVTPEGVVSDGHHYTAAAITNETTVDALVVPYSIKPGPYIKDLPIK